MNAADASRREDTADCQPPAASLAPVEIVAPSAPGAPCAPCAPCAPGAPVAPVAPGARGATDGDAASAGLLAEFSAQRGGLVRLAYRFCWNRDDAEDAVHDALLQAARRRDQLVDRGRLWSWVRSIVVRRCREIACRGVRRRRLDAVAASREAAAVQPAPGEPLSSAEAAQRVRGLLRELPERQRTAVILRHLEGMSYAEVAGIMGIAESTARVQVRNGLETLREQME